MSIDALQLKNEIIIPSLKAINLYSNDAVKLLLLTCAQESHLGKYIKQINGPALGIYQMEPATYNDIWTNVVNTDIALKAKIKLFTGYQGMPNANKLMYDLSFATIMARLFYVRFKEPIPSSNNIESIAMYYKHYYNTPLGKATIEEAVANYNRLCANL